MRKFGRVAALLVIGAAIVATDLHLRRSSVSPADHSDARAAGPNDALARELLRCQAMGIKAKDDAACNAAWAKNRRRFFAPLLDRPSVPALRSDAKEPR
jgi:conjugative transfer region protein TrbK